MEITKLSLCRLCAQIHSPNEIIGQIHDTELDIESKLIICCQWNTVNEAQSDGMPQEVCESCYRNLHRSWIFAEKVRSAQCELYSRLIKQNNAPDVGQETKSETEIDFDVIGSNNLEFKVERDMQTYSPLRMLQPIDDFDDFDSVKKEKDEKQSFNNEENDTDIMLNVQIEKDIANTIVEVDEKLQKISKFNEITFLKSIEENDRNTDGTIKLDAVQRLELDNWSIIQYKCYLCKVQLPDHYEWRSHIKLEHPGQSFRHLCNICNLKHYVQRKPLFKHVISNHRRHFKYWYANLTIFIF